MEPRRRVARAGGTPEGIIDCDELAAELAFWIRSAASTSIDHPDSKYRQLAYAEGCPPSPRRAWLLEMMDVNSDVVLACAHLVDRAGGKSFEIGYLHDGVPTEAAGWWATARFKGVKITAEDHPGPDAAAMALAQRLLTGAGCRCGRVVSITEGKPGCRWRLKGNRWEPGCDVSPIKAKGVERGDLAGLHRRLREETE